MSKKIEIEERALLDMHDRDRVLAYMRALGEVIETKRVMINYFIGDTTRSLELRIDDNTLMQVSKKRKTRGRWYEDIQILDSSLVVALKNLAIDGRTNANISLRHKYEVVHRNLIYSLRDILYYDNPKKHDSHALFELEQDIFDGHDERSRTKIHQTMRRMNIEPLSEEEFYQWVDRTSRNIDGEFNYSDSQAIALAMKLQRAGFYN